jgi:hypothetical protein
MVKRFILWDFPRGSRQYDVMVGIILAFVFLTPRIWFRDKPRIPSAAKISAAVYAVDPELLSGVPEPQRAAKAAEIIKHLPGSRDVVITHVEPIYDSEGEIKGFSAFAKP